MVMIHIVLPICVTFVIASSSYDRGGFDNRFFDAAFTALLASVTTSICLWIVA